MSLNPIAYWRLSDPPAELRRTRAKTKSGHPRGNNRAQFRAPSTFGQAPGPESQRPRRHVGALRRDRLRRGRPRRRLRDAAVHRRGARAPGQRRGSWRRRRQHAFGIVSNVPAGGWALTIVPPSPGDDQDIDGYFAPVVSDGSGPVGPPAVEFDLAKLDTAWHVAMTFDGTLFTLYWDGVERCRVLAASGTWPYAPNTQEPLQIGLDFKGAIQEVAVYDTVLAAEEIGKHFLANTSLGDLSRSCAATSLLAKASIGAFPATSYSSAVRPGGAGSRRCYERVRARGLEERQCAWWNHTALIVGTDGAIVEAGTAGSFSSMSTSTARRITTT